VAEAMLDEVVNIILSRPAGTVLYLVNMDHGYVTPSVMPAYKNASTKVQNHIKALAFCGISNIKKMILDLLKRTIGLDALIFNSTEEAMDWLVAQ
jgi:hypothetical protein